MRRPLPIPRMALSWWLLLFLLAVNIPCCWSFTAPCVQHRRASPNITPTPPSSSDTTTSHHSRSRHSTELHLLLDVPDSFFTVTFPMLGILLSISKNFARVRMEENAWEQRLAEGREKRLAADPTLTELDLRRREAALEWSAYGKPAQQEREWQQEQDYYGARQPRGGVKVAERDNEKDTSRRRSNYSSGNQEYRMTPQDIAEFELEYGIPYDPYYDDPYAEDELPEGKYSVDRLYGDRIYDNGEVFYKDKNSGLFYRQGYKPKSVSFWNL